ncbi:peptidoglycan DD-metalloendopeptidase family protein [Bacillus sp. FJAT-45350]|uniref:peptidoglycan DD-metalloendopeptidase family protein n=1 Tax=Bacillus sp. FJAT-45350 TaxID=2011014 RepID=UPI000BB8E90C|nr:M23 family metallopeptidase [Bacillus sp. FJAT-45350]
MILAKKNDRFNRIKKYKSLFSQIKSTAKSFLVHTSQKSKAVLGVAVCSALLVASPVVEATDHASSTLDTIYHVFVNGERIGSIHDKEEFELLAEEKIAELKKEFSSLQLVIGEEVELIPERVFRARTKTEETMEKLAETLTVKAEAVALEVEGEALLFVPEIEIAEEVLRALKLQYVAEEQLEAIEEEQQLEEQLEPGERMVRDVQLSAGVSIVEGLAVPEDVLSVSEAVKQLNLGTLEEQLYEVQPGDVLGSIASKHELTIDGILSLNTAITEDTLLQIGQEINVTAYEPLVTVLVEEIATIEEEIPFQTETKEDSSLWKGDTKVTQEGKPGKRVVSYELKKENGKTIQRAITHEEVIVEPVNRIVVKGTKESPSRGTGNLAWPAVGGYISSYQGMRWGRMHRGIDIARPSNYNILAADNGTVTAAGWRNGYGNSITINHNNGIETFYAHLNSIDVSVGDTVGQGQKIGVMGQTGNSTGIHLHFEVFKSGKLENPMDYLNR